MQMDRAFKGAKEIWVRKSLQRRYRDWSDRHSANGNF